MSFNIGTGFNGSVRVIKVLNSGNVLIAGTFTTYKGIPTGNLIKLDSNGNVVTSFEQSSYGSGDIWDIEVLYNDSTLTTINSHSIIVVGDFETVNDTQTRGIVKLKESDGSIDQFFREKSFSGTNTTKSGFNWGAYSITLSTSGAVMYIGGGFSMYGSYIYNKIIPLSRDGSPGTFQGQSFGNNAVTAIKNNSTINKFYVGGDFISAQGKSYSGIVRLNNNGTVDTSFSIGTGLGGGRVTSIDVQSDGKVVVGGYFLTYNSVSRYGVVRINTNGSIDTTFNMNLGPGTVVHKVKVVGNYIYMVGQFNSSSHKNIIKHNITTNTSDMIFGTGFNGSVLTLDILTNGNLLVGGQFTKYRDVNWNRLVEINSTDGSFGGIPNIEITDPLRLATFEWLNAQEWLTKKGATPATKKAVTKTELIQYYNVNQTLVADITSDRNVIRDRVRPL